MFGCESRPSLHVNVSHHVIYTWMLANTVWDSVCSECPILWAVYCVPLGSWQRVTIWLQSVVTCEGEPYCNTSMRWLICEELHLILPGSMQYTDTVCQSFMSGEILSHLWRMSLLANVLPFTLLPTYFVSVHPL